MAADLGDDVTVGHSVTLHGCTIESRCLIGMGAIILNGARIGSGSIVAAGTLITERTVIPPWKPGHGFARKSKAPLTPTDRHPSRVTPTLRGIQKYLSRGTRPVSDAPADRHNPNCRQNLENFRPSKVCAICCPRRLRSGTTWNAPLTKYFATFGFGEIRVPIFEPTELFARAVGGDTDIVSKEMYTFPLRPTTAEQTETLPASSYDFTPRGEFKNISEAREFEQFKSGETISLRPEATASVCRAYIEHGMQQLPQPVKLVLHWPDVPP